MLSLTEQNFWRDWGVFYLFLVVMILVIFSNTQYKNLREWYILQKKGKKNGLLTVKMVYHFKYSLKWILPLIDFKNYEFQK